MAISSPVKMFCFHFCSLFPFSDCILLSFLSVFPSCVWAALVPLFLLLLLPRGTLPPPVWDCRTFPSLSRPAFFPTNNENEPCPPLALTSNSRAAFSGPPHSCELCPARLLSCFSLSSMPTMSGVVPDGPLGASEAVRRARAALAVPLRSAH